jgi:hypothetical protein
VCLECKFSTFSVSSAPRHISSDRYSTSSLETICTDLLTSFRTKIISLENTFSGGESTYFDCMQVYLVQFWLRLFLFIVYLKQSHYTPWRRLGEKRYSSYSFTTSALDGIEWPASRPGRALAPGKGPPGTHCTGGWVGPRADLNTDATVKILCVCRGSNLDRPVAQPVGRYHTDWATRITFNVHTEWNKIQAQALHTVICC